MGVSFDEVVGPMLINMTKNIRKTEIIMSKVSKGLNESSRCKTGFGDVNPTKYINIISTFRNHIMQ